MDRIDSSRKEPAALGDVLSQLFVLRGYGRVRGDRQLREIWSEVAGEVIARQTRVAGIKNGVLQVGVGSSALLSELAAFHKPSLLERLQAEQPQLNVRDIKFKLRGDLTGERRA
jgi:predicted nucleic acid-binding Zn ribbon protein